MSVAFRGRVWAFAWSLLCLVATVASAQGPPSGVSEIMEGMAASRGVVADFHEVKKISVLQDPLETRGRLYFIPPDRMVREVLVPVNSRLVVDGERVEMHQGGRVQELSGSGMARGFVENFVVLFGGDRKALEERYRVDLRVTDAGWTMVLVPRDPFLSRAVEKIVLRGHEGLLEAIETYEVDGDWSSTRLENADPDRDFSAEELRELFPGAAAGTEPR